MSESNGMQPAVDAADATDFDAIEAEALSEIDGGEPVEAGSDAAVDAAVKAGDITKQEAQVLKKKLKIKVDGEESEMEVDFNNDEELKKHMQKSKAFDKRLKEHAAYKSQVDSLLEMLKNDPEGLLEKMGVNVDDLSEKRLSRKIEEMKKTPEQIENEKMNKELEDLRAEKKKLNDEKEKNELERMKNVAAQQIESDISDALSDAKSSLPKNNPLVMQRIAQTMLLAMKNGYENISAKDVIPLVERQWKEELKQLFDSSDEQRLEDLVGKANLDKYRKQKVANRPKVQTTTAKQAAQDTGTKKTAAKEEKPVNKKFRDVFDFRK